MVVKASSQFIFYRLKLIVDEELKGIPQNNAEKRDDDQVLPLGSEEWVEYFSLDIQGFAYF